METARRRGKERLRVLANWDPTFPGERINWREDFVQRHAEVSLSWFEGVDKATNEQDRRKPVCEVTGVGILYASDGEIADKVVGAMEDGSVCIWEAEEHSERGRVLARSRPGLLTNTDSKDTTFDLQRAKSIMTETGAVECVSVDSLTQRAYFGILDDLVEVDLRTLRVVSREKYPFSITALSEARYPTPMTVGTHMTLHMYDPRDSKRKGLMSSSPPSTRIELIGGSPRDDFSRLSGSPDRTHVALAQPGPLSILHLPEDRAWDGNGSIWVAGRFTSLLNYDRRFFPKLRGHLHSGARISCLRSTPNPFLPRELSLMSTNTMSISDIAEAKSIPGTTLLAAGEYKGKGSLEMYGLSPDPSRTSLSTDYTGSRARSRNNHFQNRQTASSSKLLSVAPHGGKIVFSDGDGNVRWLERDGFSPVRAWNINGHDPTTASDRVFPNEMFLGRPIQETPEDIVQLLLPTRPKSTTAESATFGEDNLVVWTGEGKLGVLGFGRPKWDLADLQEGAERFEERKMRTEEREYDMEMGSLLRAHANELNFLRGLGLGSSY
jgi:hypothetical protein